MFSETTEVRDAIDQLTARATTPEVAQAMVREMAWYDAYLGRGSADRSANTTPGNKAGGLSNIVEKAMGSIIKSRHARPFSGVLSPGEQAATKGPDLRRHTGQRLHLRHAAAGRRHEPARLHHRPGHALRPGRMPVVKVATRTDLAARWHDLMDVNAGRIADGDSDHRRSRLGAVPAAAGRGQRPQEDLGRALEAAQRPGAVQPRPHHL